LGLAVLGIELGALLHLLSCTPSPFAFLVCSNRSCAFAWDWPRTSVLLCLPPSSWDYRPVPLLMGLASSGEYSMFTRKYCVCCWVIVV
jgi:hypothetical protein